MTARTEGRTLNEQFNEVAGRRWQVMAVETANQLQDEAQLACMSWTAMFEVDRSASYQSRVPLKYFPRTPLPHCSQHLPSSVQGRAYVVGANEAESAHRVGARLPHRMLAGSAAPHKAHPAPSRPAPSAGRRTLMLYQ